MADPVTRPTIFETLKNSPAVVWPVVIGLVALWRFCALEIFPRSMVWHLLDIDAHYALLENVPLSEIAPERTIAVQCGIATLLLSAALISVALRYRPGSAVGVICFFAQFITVCIFASIWVLPPVVLLWGCLIALAFYAIALPRLAVVPDDTRALTPFQRNILILAFVSEVLLLIPAACGHFWARVIETRLNRGVVELVKCRMPDAENGVIEIYGQILWQSEQHVLLSVATDLPALDETISSSQPAHEGAGLSRSRPSLADLQPARPKEVPDASASWTVISIPMRNAFLLRRNEILSICQAPLPGQFVRDAGATQYDWWVERGSDAYEVRLRKREVNADSRSSKK